MDIAVYGWWQVVRLEKSNPIDRLSEEEADAIVAKDLAVYCNKNRAIRLLKTKRKYKLRDLSCAPRPWLIELYADDDDSAKAIIDGRRWQPICAVIQMALAEAA
jgi:hypothetical protein